MIQFKNNEREQIKQMQRMFEKMDEMYNSFSSETDEIIVNFHNEHSTLKYCIRWGLQACEELLDKDSKPYEG
jgi:calcineurin-like phosphoesterase